MSVTSPQQDPNDQDLLSYELSVRQEHQRNFPTVFRGQRVEDNDVMRLLQGLVLPHSWDPDRSKQCLSYAMDVMLASIATYDEHLAIDSEDASDTGTNDNERCLSMLVAETNQAILDVRHRERISATYDAFLQDPQASLPQAEKAGLDTISAAELEVLREHLYSLKAQETDMLMDWTWAHCGPKLKWEQYRPF